MFYNTLMKDEAFKLIFDNINIPVCLADEQGIIVYSNKSFSDNYDMKNIIELQNNKYFKFSTQVFEYDGQSYKLCYMENNIDQAHQDFVSTVSHELRTPLTSIRGFADTMLMSQDKLSKEQTNKFLNIIRNQADRLTRLVENLLEISNISKTEKLIFKKINFEIFISPIILLFEKKYPLKNYETFAPENLPEIWADSDRLEQVLTNLIDNASKYSPDNTTVTIKAAFVDNFIEIKIIDEAIKIPENQLEKIFNKFSRIDNPLTRKVEGSGLGLFITKTLVSQMNGTICAENYEKGNIFTLKMPALSVEKQLDNKMSGAKNVR